MTEQQQNPPANVKLGKAKALEVVVLQDGIRLPQKSKVRYWVERQGARETFRIIHNDKVYRLTSLEFKRRFKEIIKSGVVKLDPPPELV